MINKIISLYRNQDGMTLPFIGMALFTLVISIGMAVDYGRAQMVQSKLHASLDAAGLAAISVANSQDPKQEVLTFMEANFPQGYMGTTYKVSYVKKSGGGKDADVHYDMQAKGTVKTSFMMMAGHKEIEVAAYTRVTQSRNKGFELALVLDSTGSMEKKEGGVTRMEALKKAAKGFLDDIYGDKDSYKNIKIAIVPFVNYVKSTEVTQRPNQIWKRKFGKGGEVPQKGIVDCIFASHFGINVGDKNRAKLAAPFNEFVYSRHTDWHNTEMPPYTNKLPYATFQNIQEELLLYLDKHPLPTSIWNSKQHKHWCNKETGVCKNIILGEYDSDLCPIVPMHPLMSSKLKMKKAIDALEPEGKATRIDVGARWGWRMLSPKWRKHLNTDPKYPLNYDDHDSQKIMIIFSDGKNCCDKSDEKTANKNLADTCWKAKSRGITVYTILLHETDNKAIKVMQDCANEPKAPYFYQVKGNHKLDKVFNQIADSLQSIRISK